MSLFKFMFTGYGTHPEDARLLTGPGKVDKRENMRFSSKSWITTITVESKG